MSLDLQAADLLERTADAFESGQLGWCKGRMVDAEGNVCAAGALRKMSGRWETIPLPHDRRARELAEQHVPPIPRLKLSPTDGWVEIVQESNLAIWNDNVARSVSDVIELFKHTAKEIRNGGQ